LWERLLSPSIWLSLKPGYLLPTQSNVPDRLVRSGSRRSLILGTALLAFVGTGVVIFVVTFGGGTERSVISPSFAPHPELIRVSDAWRQFDDATSSLIDGYQDDSLSAEEWVDLADRRITTLTSSVEVMEEAFPSVHGENRVNLRNYLRIAHDQLESLEDLRAALASLDAQAERDAVRHLRRATFRHYDFFIDLMTQPGVNIDGAADVPTVDDLRLPSNSGM
jgi:hypothetical protein